MYVLFVRCAMRYYVGRVVKDALLKSESEIREAVRRGVLTKYYYESDTWLGMIPYYEVCELTKWVGFSEGGIPLICRLLERSKNAMLSGAASSSYKTLQRKLDSLRDE